MLKNLLLLGFLLVSSSTLAQERYSLPVDSVIVEEQTLKTQGYPDRALILWMIKPAKFPNGYAPGDPYMCPDETRGSCYQGPTRISLVNTSSKEIINTIKIEFEGEDSFDIPYAIRKGHAYKVFDDNLEEGIEGKPQIMWLRDYNGDEDALEFALFNAEACMGLSTTLIGYSKKQDKVVQYPVKLEIAENGKKTEDVAYWADYLFSKKPNRTGYWKYEIDYRGRCGPLEKFEIVYNKQTESFEGTLILEEPDELCK